MSLQNQPIGCTVIAFGDITGGDVEHGSAVADKAHRGRNRHFKCTKVNGCIAVLLGTGIDSQRNFNVLNIVLRQGEHPVLHSGCLATAAEVLELEVLINGRTAVGGDGTITNNVTIGIQGAAAVDSDVTVAFHLHKGNRAHRRTTAPGTAVGCIVLGGQAHSTINSDICTAGHGQRPESIRCGIAVVHRCRAGSVQRTSFIEGNQQSITGRNLIIAGRQHSIIHQSCLAAFCQSFIQPLNHISIVHQEDRLIRCKDRLHGHCCLGSKGTEGCFPAQDLVISINPGKETAITSSCGLQRCAGNIHRHHSAVCHDFAVMGYRSAGGIIFKGDIHAALHCFTAKVGQHKGAAVTGTVGGPKVNSNTFIRSQCDGERAAGQNTIFIHTAVVHPTKSDDSLLAGRIGNNNIGAVVTINTTASSTCHRNSDRAVSFRHAVDSSGNRHGHTVNRVVGSVRKEYGTVDALHDLVEALHQFSILLIQQQLPFFQRQLHTLSQEILHAIPGRLNLFAVQRKIHVYQNSVRHVGGQTVGLNIGRNFFPQGNQGLTLAGFFKRLITVLVRDLCDFSSCRNALIFVVMTFLCKNLCGQHRQNHNHC